MSEPINKIINTIKSEEIKVVSFDIFDTLLLRPTVVPTDIFKLVGKKACFNGDFLEMRKQAESEARRKKDYQLDDVTLDQIYDQLHRLFDIDRETLNLLKQTELDIEYKLLYPRRTVQKIYFEAINAGKKIIITSDMYLPKTFLEKVLRKNGYSNFERFYLSCEEGASKGSGRLFQKIIADFSNEGISPREIIHIGDNFSADITQAKKLDLNTGYIPNAIKEFTRRTKLLELIRATHLKTDNNYLIGFIANQIFDDPFTKFSLHSYFHGESEYFAKIMIAPLMLSFTKWMLEEAILDDVQLLLMTYRDGYIPERIFNILKPYYDSSPDLRPIYLSRAIRCNYFAKQKNGLFNSITDLPVHPNMKIKDFIKNRLLIDNPTEKNVVLDIFLRHGYTSENESIGNYSRYVSFIKELESYFSKNALQRVEVIDEYCRDILGEGKKIGVFDVGYRGSVSRFIKNHFNVSNIGYQILANPLVDTDHPGDFNLKSFIKYGVDTTQRSIILHSLIEDMISTQEGSAVNIKKGSSGFEIVREEKKKSDDSLTHIQNIIVDTCDQFIKLFGEDMKLLEFDHYLHFDFIVKFLTRPSKSDAELIRNMHFYDAEFINNTDNDRYEEWYSRHFVGKMINNKKFDYYQYKYLVYNLCKKYRILPFAKTLYQPLKKVIEREYNSKIDYERLMVEEVADSINEIKAQELLLKKKNIVIVGDMVSYDKGMCNYLNTLSRKMPDYNFILLSEATWVTQENTRRKISFPFFIVPGIFGKNRYPIGAAMSVSNEIRQEINKRSYLSWAVENWKARHVDMGKGYPENLAWHAQNYYTEVFKFLNPEVVIQWNQFHALHHIISGILQEMNIKSLYMEFGSLPGTVALESYGQMGESYPAQKYDEFKKQAIDKQDYEEAEEILSYLNRTRLNRNVQNQEIDINKILSKINKNRPTIFYAGQNDYESGMYPYDEHSKKYHSPIFRSSHEALIYLSKLAKKNNWNLIYKPHPIIRMLNSDKNKVPDNVIYVADADINDLIDMSDLTVTILSQVGYVSLIREKATVMLGYTQLRGKGCSYESFSEENIEGVIQEALFNGFTDEQKEAFKLHTAQLVKYYLYDDLICRELNFGKSIDQASEFITEICEERQKLLVFNS